MCENSRTIYTIATITTLLLHYKYHTNHNTNKHFLSSFSVPRRTRERKIVNKYIYHLIIKTIIITIIILLGIFSCLCVLSAACGRCRTACPSVSGWCVPGGSSGLLKLSQLVVAGSLASVGSGVEGGAVLGDILC